MGPEPGGFDRYHIYGLGLESSRPLEAPVPRAAANEWDERSSVRLLWKDHRAPETGIRNSTTDRNRVWISSVQLASGEPALTIHRGHGTDLIRYTEIAEFELLQGKRRIECRILDREYEYAAEIYLLGFVLSYWLECHHRLALHGSGVVLDGGAVVFLGAKGSGKTSLAAALMREGCPLLSDDLLAVTVGSTGPARSEKVTGPGAPLVSRGYPQMRMWPEIAGHFVGDPKNLPPVIPGGEKRRVSLGEHWSAPFANRSASLNRIYLLERDSSGGSGRVRIEPVAQSQSLIELVRESFLSTVLQAAGLEEYRLERLGRLVRNVPVRRLVYPSGLERLPAVVEEIRGDGGSVRESSPERTSSGVIRS